MGTEIEVVERVALALWHRFACGSVETWDDETAKAEYRDAAKGALEASHHAELVEALGRIRDRIANGLLVRAPEIAAIDRLLAKVPPQHRKGPVYGD